jgi:hypothetical protein
MVILRGRGRERERERRREIGVGGEREIHFDKIQLIKIKEMMTSFNFSQNKYFHHRNIFKHYKICLLHFAFHKYITHVTPTNAIFINLCVQ